MKPKSPLYLWSVVGLLFLANIVAYIDRTNLSIAVTSKEFIQTFQLKSQDRGLLNSAFFWSYALLQVPAGAVADRFGVKWSLGVGFFIWSLVSAAAGFSNTMTQFLVLRVLLGIGEAVITPASLRWIRFQIDEKQRGLAVGIFFAGAKFGPGLGAVLATWLMAEYGWRAMFIILGLGLLVWLIPWFALVKNDDKEVAAQAAKASPQAAVPFGRVFTTPAIYGILIGTFAYNYFNYFCLTWLPGYFKEHWKMSDKDMSIYTFASFSGMAVLAILAGTAADRIITRGADAFRVRKAFTIAGLLMASTEVIGPLSTSKEVALTIAIVSLTGLGLATANYWALTQMLMPAASIGRVTGVQNFASNLSGAVAPYLTGLLIDITGSYQAPMVGIFALLLVGAAAYLFLVKREYAPRCEPAPVAVG